MPIGHTGRSCSWAVTRLAPFNVHPGRSNRVTIGHRVHEGRGPRGHGALKQKKKRKALVCLLRRMDVQAHASVAFRVRWSGEGSWLECTEGYVQLVERQVADGSAIAVMGRARDNLMANVKRRLPFVT